MSSSLRTAVPEVGDGAARFDSGLSTRAFVADVRAALDGSSEVPAWDALSDEVPGQLERLLSDIEVQAGGFFRKCAGLAVEAVEDVSSMELRRDAVAIVAGAVFSAATAGLTEEEAADAFARGVRRAGGEL